MSGVILWAAIGGIVLFVALWIWFGYMVFLAADKEKEDILKQDDYIYVKETKWHIDKK